MGLYLGRLIYGTTFALVGLYGEAYIRGVFSFTSTFYMKMNKNFNSAMVVIV